MKDCYLLVRLDADEADIVYNEADALRLAVEWDVSEVLRMSADGLWSNVTADLAATHYAANGPSDTFPISFLRELDPDQVAAYRECHGNKAAY